MTAYKVLLYDICHMTAQSKTKADAAQEMTEKSEVDLSQELAPIERMAIENFVRHMGMGETLPVERLGELASLLGDDVPVSALQLARAVYGDTLTVDDVARWWVMRGK